MREWTIAHCLIANQAKRLLLHSAYTLSPAVRESRAEGMVLPFFRVSSTVLAGLGSRQRQGRCSPAGAAVA